MSLDQTVVNILSWLLHVLLLASAKDTHFTCRNYSALVCSWEPGYTVVNLETEDNSSPSQYFCWTFRTRTTLHFFQTSLPNESYIYPKTSSWPCLLMPYGVGLLIKNPFMISEAQPQIITKVYLTGLTETATLPTQTWFMASTMQSLRTQDALASHALHIFTFLTLAPLFLGLFIWDFGRRSPYGRVRGGNPEDIFPQSDSVSSTFPF